MSMDPVHFVCTREGPLWLNVYRFARIGFAVWGFTSKGITTYIDPHSVADTDTKEVLPRSFLATIQALGSMAETGSVGVHLKAIADPAAWMILGYIENPKISAGMLASFPLNFWSS